MTLTYPQLAWCPHGPFRLPNPNRGPAEKPYKLTDGGGLSLIVQPGGSKLWRMKYRFMGKEKLLSIGRYPEIGLARARKEQMAARELLVDGRDPSAVKQMERDMRLAEHARTFAR